MLTTDVDMITVMVAIGINVSAGLNLTCTWLCNFGCRLPSSRCLRNGVGRRRSIANTGNCGSLTCSFATERSRIHCLWLRRGSTGRDTGDHKLRVLEHDRNARDGISAIMLGFMNPG